MRTQRTEAEIEQVKQILMSHDNFINVFRKDWTDNVMKDLRYRLYGKIPRNFLVNIGGLVGNPTGIFKSTLGLQIALSLDPFFTLKHRVAFSVNELLDKLKNYSEHSLCNRCFSDFKKEFNGTYEVHDEKTDSSCDNCENVADKSVLLTKLIYFLDEQTKTLKHGGLTRLMNIVDTSRQRQICFITCGVDRYHTHFSTYELQRVQESNDDYLPKKTVRFAVYDTKRDLYYGYFRWIVTPLTDPSWNAFWNEYSKMKTDFQRVAISQQIQSMNFEEYAEEVMSDPDFEKCVRLTKEGKQILESGMIKNLIYRKFSDFTADERNMVLNEIKLIMYED